jgi:hypothetical protein
VPLPMQRRRTVTSRRSTRSSTSLAEDIRTGAGARLAATYSDERYDWRLVRASPITARPDSLAKCPLGLIELASGLLTGLSSSSRHSLRRILSPDRYARVPRSLGTAAVNSKRRKAWSGSP